VAFEGASEDNRQKNRTSQSSSIAAPWMEKPVASDDSWVPIAAPVPGERSLRPMSPPLFLHRTNPSPRSRKKSSGNSHVSLPKSLPARPSQRNTAATKPDVLQMHSRTTSTVSSESEHHERSHHSRTSTRGLSEKESGSDKRSRSKSRNGSPPSSRHSRTSVSSKKDGARGRSSSRSRPPPTSGNAAKNERARSRSASLSRITSPRVPTVMNSPSVKSTSSGRRPPPPSTSRTRYEKRERRDASSVGSGGRPGTRSEEGSTGTREGNIGRKFSFGFEKEEMSDSDAKSDKSKKSGIMEKIFGIHGERSSGTASIGSAPDRIRPRILLAATVYHNTATSLWITTINTNQRGVAKNPTLANKFLKAFSFSSEREARESAIANAPPKMIAFHDAPNCFVCKGKFALFKRASHCRNCGVCACMSCLTSWPAKMIPETYNLKNEAAVKICISCDRLSSSFKKAILAGDYEEAIDLYGTGNINLRTPFAVSNKKDEVMHPVHAAIEGGNINLVRWLVDDHYCPLKLVRAGKSKRAGTDVLIHTSKGRTALSIAIDRLSVDIMRYLVVELGVSIFESTDLKSSLRALEAALIALPQSVEGGPRPRVSEVAVARWDQAFFDDVSEPSSLGDDDLGTIGSRTKASRGGDSCIICCDSRINTVCTPCGHQVCCATCSSNLSVCPICNGKGEFIKVFRP
jgi:Zinc finger, C3HC4 type (RING finger)/FYVE zinc finger